MPGHLNQHHVILADDPCPVKRKMMRLPLSGKEKTTSGTGNQTSEVRTSELRPGQFATVLRRQDIRPGYEHLLEDAPAIARKALTLLPEPAAELGKSASVAAGEDDSGRDLEPF